MPGSQNLYENSRVHEALDFANDNNKLVCKYLFLGTVLGLAIGMYFWASREEKIEIVRQLSREEIESIVKEIVTSLGATSMKDMGIVMKEAKAKMGVSADGKTINEVVNGFGENENAPILGIIPAGTVNDVAHSLHISKNLKKAVKTLVEGDVFEHDIFKVNEKYGIYVLRFSNRDVDKNFEGVCRMIDRVINERIEDLS